MNLPHFSFNASWQAPECSSQSSLDAKSPSTFLIHLPSSLSHLQSFHCLPPVHAFSMGAFLLPYGQQVAHSVFSIQPLYFGSYNLW